MRKVAVLVEEDEEGAFRSVLCSQIARRPRAQGLVLPNESPPLLPKQVLHLGQSHHGFLIVGTSVN